MEENNSNPTRIHWVICSRVDIFSTDVLFSRLIYKYGETNLVRHAWLLVALYRRCIDNNRYRLFLKH